MIAALMAPIEMPDDPFRLEARATQRLKGTRLIGAERAAALQDQHTLRFGGRGFAEVGMIHS